MQNESALKNAKGGRIEIISGLKVRNINYRPKRENFNRKSLCKALLHMPVQGTIYLRCIPTEFSI